MKTIIIILLILVCTSFAKDKYMDIYPIDKYMTRYYDRMTHIVCYVHYNKSSSAEKLMKCFDVNVERSNKKSKKEKEKNENYYDTDY